METIICAAILGFIMFLQVSATHDLLTEVKKVRVEMASVSQNAVDAVTAQLKKVIGEISEAQSRGEQPDLSGLQAIAQSLDDLNPDAVEPDPTTEEQPVATLS